MAALPMLALTLPEPAFIDDTLVDEECAIGRTIQRVYPAHYVTPIEVRLVNGRYALFIWDNFVKESPTKDELDSLIDLFSIEEGAK